MLEEIVSIDSDTVADRQRVAYGFRGHNADGPFVIEQQAYYTEHHGRIDTCGCSAPDSVRIGSARRRPVGAGGLAALAAVGREFARRFARNDIEAPLELVSEE